MGTVYAPVICVNIIVINILRRLKLFQNLKYNAVNSVKNHRRIIMAAYNIRTDLALEINENVEKKDSKYKGIIVNEYEDDITDIKITVLEIINEYGEKLLKRQQGTYITVEASKLGEYEEEYNEKTAKAVMEQIKRLIKPVLNNKTILVAGLGNRDVTADSLGPDVVGKLLINRHYNEDYDKKLSICAISPGVMAQTGIETASIIKGLVDEINPGAVIAIDALAARNTERLNTTIQISDRGINPGSGVGNHRVGITYENIGVPVIAIGVPTVIDASTIVYDSMNNMLKSLSEINGLENIKKVLEDYSYNERYMLAKEVISPAMSNMYVTPKDIDANVSVISEVLANAVNMLADEI